NGGPLAGQTNAVFSLPTAGASSAGNYDVIVSNSSGTVASSVAVLTGVLFGFCDAPDPGYPTLGANDGARHRIVPGIFLGAGVDAEVDGLPDAGAAGDDTTGSDDEDGVTFLGPLRAGQPAAIQIVASTNGLLNAWFDFDLSGSWDGAGEQVFTNVALVSGTNTLNFIVP